MYILTQYYAKVVTTSTNTQVRFQRFFSFHLSYNRSISSKFSTVSFSFVKVGMDMMIPYLPRVRGLTLQSLRRLAGGLVLRLPAYTGAGVDASARWYRGCYSYLIHPLIFLLFGVKPITDHCFLADVYREQAAPLISFSRVYHVRVFLIH